MLDINEDFVNSMALNANAIKNAKTLVSKKKFKHLYKSDDQTFF